MTGGDGGAAHLLERVRSVLLALPRVTERESHGAPTFFIGRSPQIASFMDHHHGVDWVALWTACPAGAREPLLAADPGTYFVPPYVGSRGWVGVRLDDRTDWDAVADLVADAYDLLAR